MLKRRWFSQDPAGTIDELNLYAFVRNNPLRYVDHFGLSSDEETWHRSLSCLMYNDAGMWYDHDEVYSKEPVEDKYASNIASAIKGSDLGVVDFVVGSVQDLHTSFVNIGSEELDLSFSERAQMIEAIEKLQDRQRSTVDRYMTDLLSVNESDSLYQSFRSNTTMGLEIGSLLAGGFGVVKGVVAFNRLARMPIQISRLISTEGSILKSIGNSNKIWTSTKKKSSIQNAYRH
jgi:hypothetical protein